MSFAPEVEPRPTVRLGPTRLARTGGLNCVRCAYAGLVFGDPPNQVRRCYWHATADHVALVDALNQRAMAAGFPRVPRPLQRWDRVRYPYGANLNVETRRRLLDWAEQSDVRPARTGAHTCLAWLLGSRCRTPKDCVLAGYGQLPPGWVDHKSAWVGKDKTPAAVVLQPYELHQEDMDQIALIAADRRVRVELRAHGGWYGHGTYFVALWRAGA